MSSGWHWATLKLRDHGTYLTIARILTALLDGIEFYDCQMPQCATYLFPVGRVNRATRKPITFYFCHLVSEGDDECPFATRDASPHAPVFCAPHSLFEFPQHVNDGFSRVGSVSIGMNMLETGKHFGEPVRTVKSVRVPDQHVGRR
jgi:hypothetical protein